MLKIIYRACDAVHSLHTAPDGTLNPRPNNFTKKDVIKVCLRSLVDSIKHIDEEYEVHVLGDRLSEETTEFIKNNLKPNYFFNSEAPLRDSGSLLKCSEMAMEFEDEDFIYFVEDDYIHDERTFWPRVKDFINFASSNINFPWFIHPTDYPDQYKNPKRSFILQTNTGYWREVSSTTHTFMCYKKYYKLFVDHFRKCHEKDGNDGELSEIFKEKALCFSALPGIATHMHKGTYSNYIDWENIINKYND